MPDLSDIIVKTVSVYLVNSITGGAVGVPIELELYRRNLVRLVDKAVIEYMEVRHAVLDQVHDTNGVMYTISIINHLENCINSAKRALNFLEKIRKHPAGVPLTKIASKYIAAHESSIRSIRDAVEHADADIQAQRVLKDKPIAISVSGDASTISIFDHSISTHDLATVLRKMHYLALEIARYRNET